jgi:cytochrome P450
MTASKQVPEDQVTSVQPYSGEAEPMWFLDYVDRLRERHSFYWSDGGWWVLTEMAGIREAMQRPDVFSNHLGGVVDPDPDYLWIPEMLDPPEHTKWRQLLAPVFSPARMTAMEGKVRQRAAELIDGFVGAGQCDFKKDFAEPYPTTIFMELMGLPVSHSEQFMTWENAILNTSVELDPDRKLATQAMHDVMGYFSDLIAQRRTAPRDDLVSIALTWTIDGQPVSEADLLSLCLLMFMAGLDTVTCQLGWAFWHFATHDEDRQRLVGDPALVAPAVEELLRVYTIVRPGRKVSRDIEFHGCPMKTGDVVFLPLNGACRDPKAFPDADTFVIDRAPNSHIAFGGGPHRCVGSHLARRELRIAIEEWHARIPDYRIPAGSHIREFGGSQLAIANLPLEWAV